MTFSAPTDELSALSRSGAAVGWLRRLPMFVWERAAIILIWLLVIVAGVAGFGLATAVRARPTVQAVSRPTVSPAPAEGEAVATVEAWLSAGANSAGRLSTVLPETLDLTGVTGGQFSARWAMPVAAIRHAGGFWEVTVAAAVDGSGRHGPVSLGVRYYRVGILEEGEALAATSLPAEVAAPPTATLPAGLAAPTNPPSPGDPIAATATGFLDALLAGQGPIGRYEAESAHIPAVTPAPFRRVQVTAITESGPGPAGELVTAQTVGTDPAGRTQAFVYTLRLARQAGQWVVSSVPSAT